MKKIIMLGAILLSIGVYKVDMEIDGRDKTISIIEEELPIDNRGGKITRVLEGDESVYYKYEYPQEIIDEKFVMEDMVDDFYETIVDYEKVGNEEFMVVSEGNERGVVMHKGIGEICITMVEKTNIKSVEKPLLKNDLIDNRISDKLDILEAKFSKSV